MVKRILITGSRDWTNISLVHDAILYHAINGDTGEFIATIIHGDCPIGADMIASGYCRWLGIRQEKRPADWNKHGRKAGFLRNKEMVDSGADLCIAFIKNKSRGATMTVELCRKAGIPVDLYEE